MLIMFFVEC